MMALENGSPVTCLPDRVPVDISSGDIQLRFPFLKYVYFDVVSCSTCRFSSNVFFMTFSYLFLCLMWESYAKFCGFTVYFLSVCPPTPSQKNITMISGTDSFFLSETIYDTGLYTAIYYSCSPEPVTFQVLLKIISFVYFSFQDHFHTLSRFFSVNHSSYIAYIGRTCSFFLFISYYFLSFWNIPLALLLWLIFTLFTSTLHEGLYRALKSRKQSPPNRRSWFSGSLLYLLLSLLWNVCILDLFYFASQVCCSEFDCKVELFWCFFKKKKKIVINIDLSDDERAKKGTESFFLRCVSWLVL